MPAEREATPVFAVKTTLVSTEGSVCCRESGEREFVFLSCCGKDLTICQIVLHKKMHKNELCFV